VPSTASPTSYACASGYSALNIPGYPAICIQFVDLGSPANAKTQPNFETYCDTDKNGGYLVEISNTATRDAIQSYIVTYASENGWTADRAVWVGVEMSSGSTDGKKAYSPLGTDYSSMYEVTSVFTPYRTTAVWSATTEPQDTDTVVFLQYYDSGTYTKFTGAVVGMKTSIYGIWYVFPYPFFDINLLIEF
jgi:hypothetical protein